LLCGNLVDLKVERPAEIKETYFKPQLSTSPFLELDGGSSGNKYMTLEKEN